MTKIKIEHTDLLMVNCGVPEYAEATQDIDEDKLEAAIKDNIECIVKLPNSARDYK